MDASQSTDGGTLYSAALAKRERQPIFLACGLEICSASACFAGCATPVSNEQSRRAHGCLLLTVLLRCLEDVLCGWVLKDSEAFGAIGLAQKGELPT